MCRYHQLFGRLLEPAVELGSVRSALELEFPMLSNSDSLENYAALEPPPCTCGHDAGDHEYYGPLCEVRGCSCLGYEPIDRESILERENKL